MTGIAAKWGIGKPGTDKPLQDHINMKKLLLIPMALIATAFIACGGGDKTADLKFTINDTPVAEIADSLDEYEECMAPYNAEYDEYSERMGTYNEHVEEWNAHVEANDAVYEKYAGDRFDEETGAYLGDGGHFEGWMEDMGYDPEPEMPEMPECD